MNDIINWIAINNTLMIRIGFSAVLILLIVYMFRFFFVPKVSIVTEAIENKDEKTEAADDKDELERLTGKLAEEHIETAKTRSTNISTNASADINEIKLKNLEIENLKEEVLQFKTQLSASESKITDLQAEVTQAALASQAPIQQEPTGDDASQADEVSGLNKKIEQLQSRLAEYEIIAEEISEIGQLRAEND